MSKKRRRHPIFYMAFIPLLCAIFYLWSNRTLSEADALATLKTAYPEFQNYPNTNLPPQSIRMQQNADGWYVAFVQEGSGRPILGAKCFFVGNNRTIRTIGEFVPAIDDTDFSIITCKK